MAGIGKQLRGSGLARVGLAKGGKAFPDLIYFDFSKTFFSYSNSSY